VIGEVGSGKTSLLRAILREMIYVDRKHIDASGEEEKEQKYFDELQKTITDEKIKEAPIKQVGTVSYVE
jgi:ABC-type molybdenum transport system ATPase subunit/photorepair protein PhrA